MSEALAEPAVESAPAEPTEPAAPVQNWDDPALTDLVEARAAAIVEQQFSQLAPLLEQIANGGPRAEQASPQLVDEYGQLDPNALVRLITQSQKSTLDQIDQRIQQIQAPLAARFEQETVAEGEQRLNDILVDDISRNGEFSSDKEADTAARQLVRTIAEQTFPAVAQRFGPTPRAAEMAMSQAASMVRNILTADRRASQSVEQNRLATLAGARREIGASGVGVEGLSDKPLSARELAAKYGAKATALTRT